MVAEGVSRTREESQAPLPASRFPLPASLG